MTELKTGSSNEYIADVFNTTGGIGLPAVNDVVKPEVVMVEPVAIAESQRQPVDVSFL